MVDLGMYLRKGGFYPRTEDLEAILRRCDHDADNALSYEEFCEVTDIREPMDTERREQREQKLKKEEEERKAEALKRAFLISKLVDFVR